MRLVDMLAEQVEYLRLTQGRPQPVFERPSAFTPVEAPPLMSAGPAPYMSEEEEDLRAMHEAELIDVHELESALASLGIEVDTA